MQITPDVRWVVHTSNVYCIKLLNVEIKTNISMNDIKNVYEHIKLQCKLSVSSMWRIYKIYIILFTQTTEKFETWNWKFSVPQKTVWQFLWLFNHISEFE